MNKIHVKQYLNDLNENVKHATTYGTLKKDQVHTLTCNELSNLCEVTPATISNLTTDSKYSLIDKIAGIILDCYYGYFSYEESKARKENPDELIYPRDRHYVIMCLTSYYTDEWLNY